MNQKNWQNMYYASMNVTMMVADVTQIKSGRMINVGVSWKI